MDQIQNNIGFSLIQICKAHRNRAEAALNRIGLYAGQEMVLLRLGKQQGISQSELAGELCVEAPTVTKMLQRMERVGLVVRRPSAEDARVSDVFLTDLGRRLQEPILKIWQELEEAIVVGLDDHEQALLRRLLWQGYANLAAPEQEQNSE